MTPKRRTITRRAFLATGLAFITGGIIGATNASKGTDIQKPAYQRPDTTNITPNWAGQERQGIKEKPSRDFAVRDMLHGNLQTLADKSSPITKDILDEVKEGSFNTFTQEQLEASDRFKKLFFNALHNDTYSGNFPMHLDYLCNEMSNLKFFFFNDKAGVKELDFTGAFITGDRRTIFLPASVSPEEFAYSTLHEVGHIFQFPEGLADVFAEEYLGSPGLHSDLQSTDSPELSNSMFWVYCSSFERALLNRVGPKEFWKAAFTSHGALSKLWDENIDAMTYDELSALRTIHNALSDYGHNEERKTPFGLAAHMVDYVNNFDVKISQSQKNVDEKFYNMLGVLKQFGENHDRFHSIISTNDETARKEFRWFVDTSMDFYKQVKPRLQNGISINVFSGKAFEQISDSDLYPEIFETAKEEYFEKIREHARQTDKVNQQKKSNFKYSAGAVLGGITSVATSALFREKKPNLKSAPKAESADNISPEKLKRIKQREQKRNKKNSGIGK